MDIELMSSRDIMNALLQRGVAGVVALKQHLDDHEDEKQVLVCCRGPAEEVLKILCGLIVETCIRGFPREHQETLLIGFSNEILKHLHDRQGDTPGQPEEESSS